MAITEILKKINYFDEPELASFISDVVSTDKPISIGFVNQHGINLMLNEREVFESFMGINCLLRDGIGVKLACRFKGIEPKLNLNGTDFIPRLISSIELSKREAKYFVFGTEEPWLSNGAENLILGNSASLKTGFFDDDDYIHHYSENVDVKCLNVVVLAMGMPKQERIALALSKLDVASVIICGGAIIDFQAGKTKRAPALMRKLGFEWFYRLTQEPKRMFHRYVIGIPKFFFHLIH
ncbi:WecB/TagA/CpsF family glycosyltransferase [Pseudoalteromonas sp. S1612]|uniref:WecB/TagA/CpsF family glycosyltransferase n=1 Tax=Pseudoalteromonas sp. S1612 TaxID=579507 RepID=UPI00110BBB57|nr:WecB/TagA/CpsF family glycosyltransferase [Pseudoalteromonas sp. S1612]TMP52354.1 glycosyltransferase [Pseudoalteromonas sp. S1612]